MSAMPNFSPSRFLTPATDELKLISLSQQGDAEAFARLYACYVEAYYSLCLFSRD